MEKAGLFPVFAPMIVIALGALSALAFYPLMGEWAFIVLAIVYWGSSFHISCRGLGKNAIRSLFRKPEGSRGWLILSITVALIPLPILLMNLGLLAYRPVLTILWLVFAVANPFFEELFWRGYLLRKLSFPKTWGVAYSTALFVISHPLMWGIFSIANRSWMMMVSLTIMGVAWSLVYIKTKSLRWCYVSHVMVNLFNLSVFVMLNLYVPPGG